MATPQSLYDQVSEYVYGHDRAKKVLATAVLKSQAYYYKSHVKGEDVRNHSRVYLVMGHSGCGKTYLVKKLTEISKVPYMYVDATTLNPGASREGISANKLKQQILAFANNTMKMYPDQYFSISGVLSQTFVFLDEFDKMVKPYGSNDSWQDRVQSEFLALIDGDDEFAEVNWVFAGAFTEIQEEKKQESPRSIGFSAVETPKPVDNTGGLGLYSKLRRYGFTPELLGRVNSVCELDTLRESDYLSILNSILIPEKKEELAAYSNSPVVLPDGFEKQIAKDAIESGQGVRYCKRVLNEYFEELEFTLEYECPKIYKKSKNQGTSLHLDHVNYTPYGDSTGGDK